MPVYQIQRLCGHTENIYTTSPLVEHDERRDYAQAHICLACYDTILATGEALQAAKEAAWLYRLPQLQGSIVGETIRAEQVRAKLIPELLASIGTYSHMLEVAPNPEIEVVYSMLVRIRDCRKAKFWAAERVSMRFGLQGVYAELNYQALRDGVHRYIKYDQYCR